MSMLIRTRLADAHQRFMQGLLLVRVALWLPLLLLQLLLLVLPSKQLQCPQRVQKSLGQTVSKDNEQLMRTEVLLLLLQHVLHFLPLLHHHLISTSCCTFSSQLT